MGKIIACIDGSAYADSVIHLSAWIHERTDIAISLLHVVAPHSGMQVKADMSGQIGLGANANLLEELSRLDEEHSKLELQKGQLMLDHAREALAYRSITGPEMLHRRGSLVETIQELETEAELFVIGKRGEHHHATPDHLGSNLERVARAVNKPLLVAASKIRSVGEVLIAYDGSPSANRAVEFVASNLLFKGLECHLLKVGEAMPEAQEMLNETANKLKAAGMNVQTGFKQGKSVEAAIAEYIRVNSIQMLVIGAYGHSKIRRLILGSTTTALIRETDVPLLLFR